MFANYGSTIGLVAGTVKSKAELRNIMRDLYEDDQKYLKKWNKYSRFIYYIFEAFLLYEAFWLMMIEISPSFGFIGNNLFTAYYILINMGLCRSFYFGATIDSRISARG